MAGKQYAKHKTVAVYDFFETKVGPDESSSATLEDIKNHLYDLFGEEFERKSIYSDITVINDYVRKTYGVDKDHIELRGRNRYVRNPLPEELTMDEVHLLLDAVNATPIADKGIAEKIRTSYPAYFAHNDYVSFLACERQKPTRAFVSLMNSVRKAIKTRSALKIRYGYKLTDKDPANCIEKDRFISPLALYYEDNKYYLFAIDNEKFEAALAGETPKDQALKTSLRQFRIDRIANKVINLGSDAYVECDLKVVKDKISGAVDAYSEGKTVDLNMMIEGEPELVLRAFNYLRSELNVKGLINDNWNNGKLAFFIAVDPTPRFFALLTNLASFNNGDNEVRITLDGKSTVGKAYADFLQKAQENITFFDRD